MLSKNKQGRLDKQLKQRGFKSDERRKILSTLRVKMDVHGIRSEDVHLGYFDVTEDGRQATPCSDPDNLEALFCFVARTHVGGDPYIGYPNLMIRGF